MGLCGLPGPLAVGLWEEIRVCPYVLMLALCISPPVTQTQPSLA